MYKPTDQHLYKAFTGPTRRELVPGEYRKVTISMSPKLKKRLDLAVAMTDTTQVDFMISAIEPKIDDCLERFSLDD